MKVTIPFLTLFRKPMLDNIKTCTSRTKKYGNAGDTFEIWGQEFILTDVYQDALAVVAEDLWEEEGCLGSNAFISIWQSIHPIKGFVPDQVVWVHRFKRSGSS